MLKLARSGKILLICLLERFRASISTQRMILVAAPSLAPAHGNAPQLCSSPHGKGEIPPFPQFNKHEIHHWPFGKAGCLHSMWWEKEVAGESSEQGVHGKDMEQGCAGEKGDGN